MSNDRGMNKDVVYINKYYAAIKKNKIMPSAST